MGSKGVTSASRDGRATSGEGERSRRAAGQSRGLETQGSGDLRQYMRQLQRDGHNIIAKGRTCSFGALYECRLASHLPPVLRLFFRWCSCFFRRKRTSWPGILRRCLERRRRRSIRCSGRRRVVSLGRPGLSLPKCSEGGSHCEGQKSALFSPTPLCSTGGYLAGSRLPSASKACLFAKACWPAPASRPGLPG